MDEQKRQELKLMVERKISNFLRDGRERSRMSIEQVTKMLGYKNIQTFIRYENGDVPACEFVRLIEI